MIRKIIFWISVPFCFIIILFSDLLTWAGESINNVLSKWEKFCFKE